MQVICNEKIFDFEALDDRLETIKRVYEDNILQLVQILDSKNRIKKCIFYDDGKRISNITVYNVTTGKATRNITYRNDGCTISSVREYDCNSGRLLCVSFYKEDGKTLSSIIEYDDNGVEVEFSLFCNDGEVITASI
mgnify:CR=1 FL=1